ncbi:MAG: DNA repair exonuclease [Methylobacteriaceae bacterium]|jgi:DNA repair exonuclease SbcCD nuclease subunit|nr:DNA repair exonuclease [Methylobacteriaceae bacterium]
MPFRFIHTADLHLDSPLKTLAARDGELADLLAEAGRKAFERIVLTCLEQRVDALFISGDLYDNDQTSMKTARFLVSCLADLEESGTKVFIIRGNHDAESRITRELTFPDHVHVFKSGRAFKTFQPEGLPCPVAVFGAGFDKPHVPESLLPKYPAPPPGAYTVGLLHTSLNGDPAHDPYAPCTEQDLFAKGYDYWALGHIHKRFVRRSDSCAVVMPGIPQGRDIGEAGEKSVTFGVVDDNRVTMLSEVPVHVAEFRKVDVALTGLTSWREVLTAVRDAAEGLRETCRAEHLIVRPVLTGETPLAWTLRRDADERLPADIAQTLERLGRVHLDKVVLECALPGATTVASADTLMELRALIGQSVLESKRFGDEAAELFAALTGALPTELRDRFGRTEKEVRDIRTRWIAEGVENVLAQLAAPGGRED